MVRLVANCFNDYQIIDLGRRSVKKHLDALKVHSPIKNKHFKRLAPISDHSFELEPMKSESEYKEHIIVGFL